MLVDKEWNVELLDEKGFVFLDDVQRPYLCRMWQNAAWLFYWHPDNHWVSLRKVTQTDLWLFPRNLTAEQQQIYYDLDSRWRDELAPMIQDNFDDAF